jgi:hypothetical protein
MATTRKRSAMTAEHKEALAAGRASGLAVRRYLEALEQGKPRRGRKVSPDSIAKKLADVESELVSADALRRLHLIQERTELRARLEDSSGSEVDRGALEAEFVKVAKEYGDRKSIDYATWREAGVPADVLQRAGIARSKG